MVKLFFIHKIFLILRKSFYTLNPARNVIDDARENQTEAKRFLVSGQLFAAGTFDFRGDKIKRALLPAADCRGITTRRNA